MEDLEEVIEKCLFVKGRAILPHWGIFTVHRNSASIDRGEGTIHPPYDEISFLSVPQMGVEELETELSQFIFTDDLDVSALSAEINSLAEAKKSEGSWEIGSLGKLSTDSNVISWRAFPAASWSILSDLPDIKLPHAAHVPESNQQQQPAQKDKESVNPIPDQVSADTAEKKSSKSLFIILVFVLLLAIIMLIANLMFWDPFNASAESAVDSSIPSERTNVHPEAAISSVKRTSDTENTQLGNSPFELGHRSDEIENESRDESDIINSENEEMKNEESLEESMSAQSLDHSSENECVIIVGAFSSKDNIQNMQSRLSEQGYNVYLSDAQSLTRVGVYAPCPSKDILQELRTIRKEIEPAAWILNE